MELGADIGIWYGIMAELGMELGCGFDRSWVEMFIYTDFFNLYEYWMIWNIGKKFRLIRCFLFT